MGETLVPCPYCKITWISTEETVCLDCEDRYNRDLIIAEALGAIDSLYCMDYNLLFERLSLIESIRDEAQLLMERMK